MHAGMPGGGVRAVNWPPDDSRCGPASAGVPGRAVGPGPLPADAAAREAGSLILESVLEREPGNGSIQFSAYGFIAPTRRLTCVASMTCARTKMRIMYSILYMQLSSRSSRGADDAGGGACAEIGPAGVLPLSHFRCVSPLPGGYQAAGGRGWGGVLWEGPAAVAAAAP